MVAEVLELAEFPLRACPQSLQLQFEVLEGHLHIMQLFLISNP